MVPVLQLGATVLDDAAAVALRPVAVDGHPVEDGADHGPAVMWSAFPVKLAEVREQLCVAIRSIPGAGELLLDLVYLGVELADLVRRQIGGQEVRRARIRA